MMLYLFSVDGVIHSNQGSISSIDRI